MIPLLPAFLDFMQLLIRGILPSLSEGLFPGFYLICGPYFLIIPMKRWLIGTGIDPDGAKICGTGGKTWTVFNF